MPRKHQDDPSSAPPPPLPATKKNQILSLFTAGVTDVAELAILTHAKPSYVASVLHASGLLAGYFDLYTHSQQAMNVYSHLFQNRVGFKDMPTAKASVALINELYEDFAADKDRAGQHHAMTVALTMFDRARWSGKAREAQVFQRWLLTKLHDDLPLQPL